MNPTSGLSKTQKALFHVIYGFLYALSTLPLRALYILSDALYIVLYYIIRYRRKLVRTNLTESFPQKTNSEITKIEHEFYHWLCDYMFETIKLASISKEEMQRRMIYNNVEHLDQLLQKGHNIALYLGHYCNWEWVTSVGLYIPKKYFGGQVYHPLQNKVMNAIMLKLRSRMGTESIAMANVMRKIISTRRAGVQLVLGFISDQVPIYPNTHFWSDFLNHKDTLFITGTERLAKQADFACVYLEMSRPRRGMYEINIIPMTEKSSEYADFQITEMYVRMFEKNIQQNPQFWLWTHKRWKRTFKGFIEWSKAYNKVVNTDFKR